MKHFVVQIQICCIFFLRFLLIVIEKMCLYNSKDGVQGRAGQTLKKSKNTFKK